MRTFLATLVAVAVVLGAGTEAISGPDPDFAPGQEWSIKSTSPTTAKVIIGRIEPWNGKVAVQVSVIDVPVPEGAPGAGGTTIIGHMPFEKTTLAASVDKLIGTDVLPPATFESGYEQWKSAGGGIYTIGVAEAVALVFEAIAHGHQ